MGFFKPVIFLLAAISPPAHAFTLNTSGSTLRGWDTKTLSVDYNLSECPAGVDHAQLLGVIDRALEVWNGVPSSSIRLSRGSEVTTSAATANAATSPGTPLIACDQNFSQRVNSGEVDVVPGLTVNVRLDPNTARIVFGAVLLNAQSGAKANIGNVSADELTIVLAHEIGHLLGIGHSQDTAALMYYDLTAKKSATLAMDDLDAMAFLYPRDEPFSSGAMGCGTTSGPPASGTRRKGREGPAAAAELGLLLVLAWFAVRLCRNPLLRA